MISGGQTAPNNARAEDFPITSTSSGNQTESNQNTMSAELIINAPPFLEYLPMFDA